MNRSYSYFVQLLVLLFVSYKMYDTLQLSNAMQRHATREIHSGAQPSVLLYDDKIHYMGFTVLMRQGRRSEATEDIFSLQAKKPLPGGSYERRVPKIKNKTVRLRSPTVGF